MIRPALPDEASAIRQVISAAFGRADEADLVDRLRHDGDALVELVAVEDLTLVGHILFSRLIVGTLSAAALAPVSVVPNLQRSGIGSALITAGIERCRLLGVPAIVVLGHPGYYPRFGFSPELARQLDAPFSGPSFMALELQPGSLMPKAQVRYAAAFGL